jgi:CRISPR-associated exonuclease Cas4
MEINSNDYKIDEASIRGIEVAYYIICKRKLWLFSFGINFEKFSDYVEMGKIISESFFKKERLKEIEIGSSKIDFIKVGDEIIVNEVKKSKKLEEAHIWQTKFYIYTLQKLGINSQRGVIHYPKLLRKIDVELSEDDKVKITEALSRIREIKILAEPPGVVEKGYCKKCAYYEFCFS